VSLLDRSVGLPEDLGRLGQTHDFFVRHKWLNHLPRPCPSDDRLEGQGDSRSFPVCLSPLHGQNPSFIAQNVSHQGRRHETDRVIRRPFTFDNL